MYELLARLDADQITAVVIVLGTLAVVGGVALAIVGMTRSYLGRKQRTAAKLVSEMVAAGYSAADIERTLECAGFYERSTTSEFVRDLGASIRAKAGAAPA